MQDFERLYHTMFNAATDALRSLAQRNYGAAQEVLIAAQKQAEETYLLQELHDKR